MIDRAPSTPPEGLELEFERLDLSVLHEFVESRHQENLHLDFKKISRADRPAKSDKQSFAKAVSGFANSDGGLIVWGIDARKSGGIDAACDLCPVLSPDKFRSRLEQLTGESTSPRVDGIRHKTIREHDGKNGYVVTLVPVSDFPPHMAKLGENKYYKRSGESFYSMEHFDLEDMFGRRARPQLQIVFELISQDVERTDILLGIRNCGKGLARFPCLEVTIKPPRSWGIVPAGVDGRRATGLTPIQTLADKHLYTFSGRADDVIYPGQTLYVTRLNYHVSRGDAGQELPYRIFSEGMKPVKGTELLDLPAETVSDQQEPPLEPQPPGG